MAIERNFTSDTQCSVCGQVTAHICATCHKPICRQHSGLYRVGSYLRDYCEDCAPLPTPRVRRDPAPAPESRPAAIEVQVAIEGDGEVTTEQSQPQSAPIAYEWQDTCGARYRLVMSQTDSGKRQLITEYCQQDSLGNDSWRILEVARDAQAACAHLYDALRAFEVALARVTLDYPD